MVHPHNHMQHLLKVDLHARMQRQAQVQKPKPAARSLRLRLRVSRSTTAQQQLSSELPVEALMAAPGRDFLHVDAPGLVLARVEASLLLKQYSYKAELYGVQDRSMETVEAVCQPWYQTLLDMGSIQVRLHFCLLTMLHAVTTCCFWRRCPSGSLFEVLSLSDQSLSLSGQSLSPSSLPCPPKLQVSQMGTNRLVSWQKDLLDPYMLPNGKLYLRCLCGRCALL